MNELMDRLARANPTPTEQPLTAEEHHDADALLERILADPVPAEPPRRAPTLRRVAPAAALLAVLGLAVVVVLDLVSSEKRNGGIVERAIAAVSRENVIYATTERATFTSKALEPGVDPPPDERGFGRTWLWPGGDQARFLSYRVRPDGGPGRLRREVVSTPERMVWYDANGDTLLSYKRDPNDPEGGPTDSDYPGFDPYSNPGHQLRRHVEDERLRVAGRTTVRGRTAYRLVSAPFSDRKAGIERETASYLVDARTYLPLEVHNRVVMDESDSGVPGGGRYVANVRIEYLRYQALPVTDETKRLLEKSGGRRP